MRRSFLFVPADDAKRLARVHERGADAVIVDLEDAVGAENKDAARAGVGAAIAALSARGVAVFVRINSPWRMALADLEAAVAPGLSGIVAPKIGDAAQALVLGEMIREVEAARGVGPGATEFIALIESAAGLHNAAAIAAVAHITGIALGTEDLCVELGVAPTASSLDLPCKHIALAAAPRGLMALGAPVSISEFRDIAAYGAGLDEARRIGMTGVFCIHPAQVEAANACFAPTEAELAEARGVLAAWAAAQQKGQSVLSHNGRMIDAPVVARAKRLVERR